MRNNNGKAISAKTVSSESKYHHFCIYLRDKEIGKVSLPSHAVVADLMVAVRAKMESSNLPVHNFICLESMDQK